MSKIITQKEFLDRVNSNNPYVQVVGKYQNMDDKIECICKICGEHYYAKAYDIVIGKKHNKCSHILSTKKRTKSNEDFVNELKQVSPHIVPIDPYVNAKTKIKCYCEKHNTYFWNDPDHLLHRKMGCPECKSEKISKSLLKSEEDFLKEANINNPEIQIIGKYSGSHNTIKVKCNKCGFEWEPTAGSVLKGYGCPHCVGRHKTTEEFKDEIKLYNPDIEIISEYINASIKVKCKCKKCGHIWDATPGSLRTNGCPVCRMSHGERKIKLYLDKNNVEYISQKTFDGLYGIGGKNLSYDFYIEKFNLLIEYQGEFHDGTAYQQSEEDYKKQIEHDRRKREYALNNGYDLLEIWYWDFNNINNILERKIG